MRRASLLVISVALSVLACSSASSGSAGAAGGVAGVAAGNSSGSPAGGAAGESTNIGGAAGFSGLPASGAAGESAGGSTGASGSAGALNNVGGAAGASGGVGTAGAATAGNAGTAGAGNAGIAACSNANADEFSLVSTWLNDTAVKGALPSYAYSNIKTNFPAGTAFDRLACSIATSCAEFAPMESNWLRKCEAVVTSAIVAESSYTPSSVVVDTYATRTVGNVTANDPTVGLLQIRFSSTVHDYNYHGPLAKMTAIGCTWPTALPAQADTDTWWATNGGTTYLSFMQDVACNIGLASWYYFYNATGNGGANAVYINNYCSGQGVAGTMVTGLLSHLLGGSYPRPADANNAYPWGIECCAGGNPSSTTCTGCTGRFAAFMSIGTSSARPTPDPFLETLAPEPTKYCK